MSADRLCSKGIPKTKGTKMVKFRMIWGTPTLGNLHMLFQAFQNIAPYPQLEPSKAIRATSS